MFKSPEGMQNNTGGNSEGIEVREISHSEIEHVTLGPDTQLSEKDFLAKYNLTPENISLTPEEIANILPTGAELDFIKSRFAEVGIDYNKI